MGFPLDWPHSKPTILVVGSVRRIIGRLDLREPLDADGVDLGDPVLEGGPFDLILYSRTGECLAG